MLGFCDLLLCTSSAMLGLFAGAMLTEGFVLVPWWRSLPPDEFYAWYASNDRRLLAFFGPVTSLAATTAVAAAGFAWWTGHAGRWEASTAAALVLVAVATFFAYFEKANAQFSAGSIPAERLGDELARWARWHRARTVLSLLAVAVALLAPWSGRAG